jgi:hypothetical protein
MINIETCLEIKPSASHRGGPGSIPVQYIYIYIYIYIWCASTTERDF